MLIIYGINKKEIRNYKSHIELLINEFFKYFIKYANKYKGITHLYSIQKTYIYNIDSLIKIYFIQCAHSDKINVFTFKSVFDIKYIYNIDSLIKIYFI